MALVFFTKLDDPDTIISLDVIETISVSRSSEVTSRTIQSGATISDHINAGKYTVSFSGLITNSKVGYRDSNGNFIKREDLPNVSDFVNWVDELISSETAFVLYGSYDDGIPTLSNCAITNFSYDKGVRNFNSLQVAFTVQEMDFGMVSQKTSFTLPASSTNGQLNDKADGGTGSKTSIGVDPISGKPFTQEAIRKGIR